MERRELNICTYFSSVQSGQQNGPTVLQVFNDSTDITDVFQDSDNLHGGLFLIASGASTLVSSTQAAPTGS